MFQVPEVNEYESLLRLSIPKSNVCGYAVESKVFGEISGFAWLGTTKYSTGI